MNLKLKGKKALVTGSTAGIGLAIAKGLAEEGAIVYVNGRTQNRIDAAISQIRQDVPDAVLHAVKADFSDPSTIKALLESVVDIDILVNNVGIFEPREFAEITDEEWHQMFEVNVMSGVRLTRKYLPGMLSRNWGRVIFVSSESGIQIDPRWIHYGMTKTALLGLSNGLARLTRGKDVTVNSVLPGSTYSEGAEAFVKGLAQEQGKTVEEAGRDFIIDERPNCLLERFATTEEVANMVVYLCSPLASATNGAALRVEGGTIPTIL